MADELIDICDENNNIIGRALKSEALAKGLWHRTARVFFYTSKGEIILQLRAKNKELYPDRWDVGAAGHIGAGEDYIDAAIRESEEELGIIVKKSDLDLLVLDKFLTIWGDFDEKIFAYTYLARFDGDIEGLKIQKEEVQELKFANVDWLVGDVKNSPQKYTPHAENYWLRLISGVKERLNNGK
jgi:isopentenyl-diphosphate Delta-isomerase